MPTKSQYARRTPEQKAQHAADQRARRAADPQKAYAKQKAYRAQFKDKFKEIQKRAYEKNKEHHQAIGRAYYHSHKEQKRLYQQEYRAKTLIQRRVQHVERLYGLSKDAYQELSVQQNETCAICQKPETALDRRTGRVKPLHVDHCHSTKRIRGLLCHRCNSAIGLFHDSPDILRRAIGYLQQPEVEKQTE